MNPVFAQEIFSDNFEGAGSNPGDPEPFPLQGLTAAHNVIRANVIPAANPVLTPLIWDDEIAADAQKHADQCQFVHSSNGHGENIFAAASLRPIDDVMDSWASEADDYHYDTNTCSGACGHYTQMVWDDTRRLGCGYKMCTTGSPFNGFPTWHFWVCDYDPRGNLNGIRPY